MELNETALNIDESLFEMSDNLIDVNDTQFLFQDTEEVTRRIHVRKRLKSNDVKKPNKHFIQAVMDGDKDTTFHWLETGEKVLNQFNYEVAGAFNALHQAIINNKVEMLRILCNSDVDVNKVTKEEIKNPPLVLAALHLVDELFDGYGHLREGKVLQNNTFQVLVQQPKIDVNAANLAGITALHIACSRGNGYMVKELLKVKGIQINKKDRRSNTPLHAACVCGNPIIVEELIRNGATLSLKNDDGRHPLQVTVVEQNLEVVNTILKISDKSTQQNLILEKDKRGYTSFLLAVKSGNELMVKLLLGTTFVKLTDHNHAGAKCFHLAASINKVNIMQMIYEYDPLNSNTLETLLDGQDFNSKDTPLHCSAMYDHVEAARFLIQRKAALECRNGSSKTPLLTAAAYGSIQCLELLIQSGASVTTTDSSYENILHSVVSHQGLDELKMCIMLPGVTHHEFINEKNQHGKTPLHMACEIGHNEIVMELLNKGAKMTLKTIKGDSPLHLAACEGHLEICKLLVKNNADVDIINERTGWTPLTSAAHQGHVKIVQYLIDNGADKDGNFSGRGNSEEKHKESEDKLDETSSNATPLIAASRNGHVEVVELLLSKGANITIEYKDDYKGEGYYPCNCLVFAILYGHRDVALTIVKSDNWEDAMRWRAESDKYGQYTPMKLLITRMPDVATEVLNRCIVRDQEKRDGSIHVTYNYEFLDDIYKNDNSDDSAHNEHIKTTKWVASHFKKEAHPLKVMVDSERIKLLNHPLATKLLDYKWRSFGLYFYLLNLIAYCVFLSCITTFSLMSPTPNSDECATNAMQNISLTTDMDDCEANHALIVMAIISIAFSAIRIFLEVIQVYNMRLAYLFELDNWLEVFLFGSSIIFVSYGLQTGCQCPPTWQWQFGAVIVLIAWLNLLLFLKKFPLTGVYVLMFVDILYTILKMILLPALFVISFGLTFYMIFYRPGTRSSFSSPGRSLIKTLVMATGEFDFDVNFFNSQEDAEEGNNLFYPHVAYALWIVFIILMPIILTNLLIGLAVDDIKGIQENAALKRLALKVELTLNIEELFFIRKYYRKKTEQLLYYNTDSNDQFLKRNQPRNTHSLWLKFKQKFLGYNEQHEDIQRMPTMEEVLKEVEQLKTMIGDMNKKAKARDEQQAKQIELLSEQNDLILSYLKRKCDNDNIVRETASVEELQISVVDDYESVGSGQGEYTLQSSHSSKNNDDGN